MKHFLTSTALLLASLANAQNLVPNPSFEQLDTCTSPLDGIEVATFWYSTLNTPDLYNACSTEFTSVPSNFCGYQQPATGNGYAGLAAYEDVPGTTLLHHEIICTQLTQSLVVGQAYHASMRASATTATTIGGGDSRFVSNNLGMLCLMECGHHSLNSNTTINHAHVWSTAILSDSLNWSTIEGDFIADSAYEYIAIGNFFSDSQTDAEDFFPLAETQGSYYYIDDISLTLAIGTDAHGTNLQERAPNAYYDRLQASIILPYCIRGSLLVVYDALGRIVLHERVDSTSSSLTIPFTSQANGLYVLEVQALGKTQANTFIVSDRSP